MQKKKDQKIATALNLKLTPLACQNTKSKIKQCLSLETETERIFQARIALSIIWD